MKKDSRKKILLLILILLFISVSFFALNTFSSYKKEASGTASTSAARFIIKINDSSEITQTINLSETITENDYSDTLVVPGTEGVIDLELDFSNCDISVNYIVNFDITNLPINLKLYSDSNHLNQITSLNEEFNYGDDVITNKKIYWQWEYKTDATSDANDNLYMDTEIELPISITLTQKIGGGN